MTKVPQAIRLKIKEKNWLRKLYQRTQYPPLKKIINQLQRSVRAELKTRKEHVWDSLQRDANIDPDLLHKLIAEKRKKNIIYPPLLPYQGLRRFRLTKESVAELTLLIEHKLESKTSCNNALSPLEQVLIALRFYAVACMQLAIADLFDVSQPTVCRVVHRVSEAIASLLPDFIHLPVNREECKRCGSLQCAGFPIVTLDGTFVRIISRLVKMRKVSLSKSYFIDMRTIIVRSDQERFGF
ncbi:nuclease HARBI1 [Trichonephila clavata]|uniref:Nuclease HARBI1 n=1 Tax=Trichonephila clavata TaxID=2740835 RepID=A0A8X6J9Q6_TRICU|nr:nuclease HARBI1 [Trichonephila clavata]